jgi:hypothetical protein
MNDRQRFWATMHYQPRDRAPLSDFGFWDETLTAWYEQGLPRQITPESSAAYFGMEGLEQYLLNAPDNAFSPGTVQARGEGIATGLVPGFEERVLEDRGDHEVAHQADGVRVLRRKAMGSIPQHLAHALADRDSWRRLFKPRLDPSQPERLPAELSACVRWWGDPAREHPLFLPAGSLYGRLRSWMGVENLSRVVLREPAWFEEMVTTVADCVYGVLERVLATGVQFDGAEFWEDMCFNTGPLLSPRHVRQYLVPHYRRITGLLRRHGVDVIWVDCDGKVDALLPLWLEAGVNGLIPVEVGTWGADPVALRREYGRELLMLGGFNKRILAGTPAEIEREVARLAPLVAEGGYIGFCDHRVPPDVPLANYRHYVETVRRVWAGGVNLKPVGW